MSAAEILKQVKALSPREREKFFRAAFKLQDTKSKPSTAKAKRVKWPDIEARARKIFGDRIMPNPVLLEREEARY
jgi:hypothetical protein